MAFRLQPVDREVHLARVHRSVEDSLEIYCINSQAKFLHQVEVFVRISRWVEWVRCHHVNVFLIVAVDCRN